MESSKITPFGEYGIKILDYRHNSVCKPDVTRLNECDYLMQRGCVYDIYKWDEKQYDVSIRFDGNKFTKRFDKKSASGIESMHIWFQTLEDLQKWLGEYYDSAISCMLTDLAKNDYYLDNNISSSNAFWSSTATFSQAISGAISSNSVNEDDNVSYLPPNTDIDTDVK